MVIALAATLGLSATARAQAQAQGQGQWEKQGKPHEAAQQRAKPTAKRRPPPNERTKGLMLGVHTVAARGLTLSGGAWEAPLSTNFGMGAGAMIGYGFNRAVSSYVALDIAKQGANRNGDVAGNSFGLGHVEIGARTNLPVAWPNTVPYVSGSVGRRALGARAVDDDGDVGDLSIHGRMVGLGVGIEHFLTPTLSFDGGVQLALGKLDNLELAGRHRDIPVNGTTSTRLRFGVTWRPVRRG
ncbi:MAG: hypothetical protein ACRENH_06740 [Gemmatimonadaceae bacterium]